MNKVKSLTDALIFVYSVTDCRNEVFDYGCPRNGKKYFVEAEKLGLLTSAVCDECDDDGFLMSPERQLVGYQLTTAGYDALFAFEPKVYDARRVFRKESEQ